MRLLAFVWTLAVAVAWCCDGAMLYDPLVQRDARWYDLRAQDLESVDKNFLDMAPVEKRIMRNSDNQDDSPRSRPSLSIVNSLDVLRQKLMYEVARRQVDENQKVISQNHQILKTLGKRSLFPYFGVPQRF